MAITQCMTTSFKAQLFLAVNDFRPSADTGASIFKVALYTSLATLDANTASYLIAGETTGTGYTAGGMALTNLGVTASNVSSSNGVGWLDFADATFSGVTVTARGALIYNSTPKANSNANTTLTNVSVCNLDFGSDKSATGGVFTIQFPTPDYSNAILRIA